MDTLFIKYEEVLELLEEKSKLDPATEPYQSKYAAREILEDMKRILSEKVDDEDILPQVCSSVRAQFAAVTVYLGIIGLDTEELSTGQEHLEKVIELLSGLETLPLCIYLSIWCRNYLAILWAQREEQESARKYLDAANEFYLKYKTQERVEPPKTCHEIFSSSRDDHEGWTNFENLHTYTLYYLAQVMGKLGYDTDSARLCLTTLHRQLGTGEYQLLTWAVNAATLAQFYQAHAQYRVARRLLSAAWTVLEIPSSGSSVGSPSSKQEEDSTDEKFLQIKAEVSRRWGQYCLCLLQNSYDTREGNKVPAAHDVADDLVSEEECLEKMEFSKLELTLIEESAECQITKTYEGACKIFKNALQWMHQSHTFYTLDEHASTHTEIAQEISILYKLLAEFEPEPDRRSKMHKRRVDVLTAILNELNPQHYLNVCRQLNYEVGETYSSMIDEKYQLIGTSKPTLHQAIKVNSLANSSAKHFHNYLESFTNQSDENKVKYPEGHVRPALNAHFRLGRIWSKVISTDIQEKIKYLNKSIASYKVVVDYCESNPESCVHIEEELSLCKDMVELLPLKLDRLRLLI